MSSTLKTAVGVTNRQGVVVVHDITPVVGEFSPKLLCYLTGIREVYITMVDSLDAMDLVECLPYLRNMETLVINRCANLHDSHVVKIAEKNEALKYIDVSKSVRLSFETVHYILGSLKDIQYLAFDPKYPDLVSEWKRILSIFRFKNVVFGGEIAKYATVD